MLYIVSGTSRSGKTTVARTMLARHGIPYFSLDWLMMGFTHGMPELGIHDKLWPDEIARRLWPVFRGMCENMLWSKVDYLFEGEALMPEMVKSLFEDFPGSDLQACGSGCR